MARSKKKRKNSPGLGRRRKFMTVSAMVLGLMMAGSLIGASVFRKTQGHLQKPVASHAPQKKVPSTPSDALGF